MIRANYESDAGKRKEIPPEEIGTIPHLPFEEYSERLKHCLLMKRETGILQARLHTNGDSMQWGAPAHQGLHCFFDWAGRDPDNEIIILGGTGKDFTKGVGRIKDGKREPAYEFASAPEVAWRMYEFYEDVLTIQAEGSLAAQRASVLAMADFARYKAAANRAARIKDGSKHPIFDQLPEFPPKL
jgi:hypothetical protein